MPLLRKRVGMVFQQPNPFLMSIYDNIEYDTRLHGVRAVFSKPRDKRTADYILGRFG